MRIVKLLNCYFVRLMVGSDDGKIRNYQSGQVLLISLLVLVVAMTIGLSVAVRTITTIRMTTAEDSSQRAFSAAEAGLERSLTAGAGQTITGDFMASNDSKYEVKTSELKGDDILLDNGALILKDDAVDVWLSDYPDYTNPWPPAGSRDLSIYWGDSADVCDTSEVTNTMAALEVVLISGTEAVPLLTHYAYDRCVARRGDNKFSAATTGAFVIAGKTFANSVTISVTSGLLVRIIPLYARTYIGVHGDGLPVQGIVATSIGNSGGTQRKIVSFRGYPKPPVELYPFLIFSPK